MANVRSLQQSCCAEECMAAAHQVAQQVSDALEDEVAGSRGIGCLQESGLLSAPLPLEHGGTGLGTSPGERVSLCSVLRILGSGSLALGRIYESHVNAVRLICTYGNDAQVARLAADLQAGFLFGVQSGPGSQNDLQLIRDEPAGFILHGNPVAGSDHVPVQCLLTTAHLPSGDVVVISVHLTEKQQAAMTDRKAGEGDAATEAAVDLSGSAISPDDIIAIPRDQLEAAISDDTWRSASVHLGGIERLLGEVRRHYKQIPRGHAPDQLACLGEAAMAVETARLWIERAAHSSDASNGRRNLAAGCTNLARLAVEKAGLCALDVAHRSLHFAERSRFLDKLSRDLVTYLGHTLPEGSTMSMGLALDHSPGSPPLRT